jgi:hypothetical protein
MCGLVMGDGDCPGIREGQVRAGVSVEPMNDRASTKDWKTGRLEEGK